MCDTITNSFYYVWEQIQPPLKEAGTAIYNVYSWAGREVEVLTNRFLPEKVAKVVSDTAWGLPYTVSAFMLPGFSFELVNGLIAGIWERFPKQFEAHVGTHNRKAIFIGLQNGCLARVGFDLVRLVLTRQWSLLIPIIVNITMALQHRSSALSSVSEPAPQT